MRKQTSSAVAAELREPQRASGFSLLGEGCAFSGKMFLHGEVRLGGKVEGIIFSDGVVIIEESASICGTVNGVEVQIRGHVNGNINAKNRLVITNKGRIDGDVEVASLIVEEGGRIDGRIAFIDGANQAASQRTLQAVK